MVSRKYVVHISGVGLAVVLTIYATSCQPLLPSQTTQIARQYVNPACVVQSYNIEVPKLPQNPYSTQQLNNSAVLGTPASNVSISAVSGTLTLLG